MPRWSTRSALRAPTRPRAAEDRRRGESPSVQARGRVCARACVCGSSVYLRACARRGPFATLWQPLLSECLTITTQPPRLPRVHLTTAPTAKLERIHRQLDAAAGDAPRGAGAHGRLLAVDGVKVPARRAGRAPSRRLEDRLRRCRGQRRRPVPRHGRAARHRKKRLALSVPLDRRQVADERARAGRVAAVELAQDARVGACGAPLRVDAVQHLGRRRARVAVGVEQPAHLEDGRDQLCAEDQER